MGYGLVKTDHLYRIYKSSPIAGAFIFLFATKTYLFATKKGSVQVFVIDLCCKGLSGIL